MDSVGAMLVVVSGLILLGGLGEFVFSKTGVPDAIWLVVAGILLGPVFGVVSPDLLRPAVPYFGAIALTIILTGGAYRLQLREVASAAPRGLLLAVLGFMFSMVGICLFFWVGIRFGWIRDSPVSYWLLVGAIVSGTSALIVMPTVADSKIKIDASVARTLDVESSATDALSVVVAMAMLDLLMEGATEITQPFISFARQTGIGLAAGVAWSILLVPFFPALRVRQHSYTMLTASMFLLYALTEALQGNGAMAVMISALLAGNGATIVPRLIPGASAESFVPSDSGITMQSQITFLIKSFFFVLIGLMFPTEPRAIVLGVVAAIVLVLFRIPAVAAAVRGRGFTRKQKMILMVAMPRGLAAGVLSTLPGRLNVPGTEVLTDAVFAMIVSTIVMFALGIALIARQPDQ